MGDGEARAVAERAADTTDAAGAARLRRREPAVPHGRPHFARSKLTASRRPMDGRRGRSAIGRPASAARPACDRGGRRSRCEA